MKKKVIIILTVLILIVGVGGFFGYRYFFYTDFEYNSMALYKPSYMEGKDYYIECISESYSVLPQRKEADLIEFNAKNTEIFNKYVEINQSDKTVDMHACIVTSGGRTTVTYYGTVTDSDGKAETINEVFTVNSVFTSKIPEVFQKAD